MSTPQFERTINDILSGTVLGAGARSLFPSDEDGGGNETSTSPNSSAASNVTRGTGVGNSLNSASANDDGSGDNAVKIDQGDGNEDGNMQDKTSGQDTDEKDKTSILLHSMDGFMSIKLSNSLLDQSGDINTSRGSIFSASWQQRSMRSSSNTSTSSSRNMNKRMQPSLSVRTVRRAGTTFTACVPNPSSIQEGNTRISNIDAIKISSDNININSVVNDFMDALDENPDLAVAVAAIRALTAVIERSAASTMHGIEKELSEASDALKSCNLSAISLSAGCELFKRFVTRTSFEAMETNDDFEESKARLIQRGRMFEETSLRSRNTIAELGARFVGEGCCVLIHGYSRVVISLVRRAAMSGRRFRVIVTEGRPDAAGVEVARVLRMPVGNTKLNIPVTLVLDSAVGFIMDKVDMVIVGAEGVVESGGIINKLGTFQIATVANALGKPVYVAAESYKFARFYPLSQRDFPCEAEDVIFHINKSLHTSIERKCGTDRSNAAKIDCAHEESTHYDPKLSSHSENLHSSNCTSDTSNNVEVKKGDSMSIGQNKRSLVGGNAAVTKDENADYVKWLDDVPVLNPSRDYTPPQSITLLFTDLGVLTPSAVSDELIQLYL